MRQLRMALLLCGSAALPTAARAGEGAFDVVVYGGTSGAVTAAVQAARMGRSVALVSPDKHLGGLTSGGLGWTDLGKRSTIGGLAREFYHRVFEHYEKDEAWTRETRDAYVRRVGRGHGPGDGLMPTFEPHVAEAIFDQWVAEHDITLAREARLDREGGVRKEGERILAITTLDGTTWRGRLFIDATYEGDLLAAAGVSYTVGREGNDAYGETLNGVQKARNVHNHRFRKPVSPYKTPGDPESGLVPRVHGDPPGEDGQGDRRVQAYCFRMCMTDDPENRVPWPKPAGYDEAQYELLFRHFEAGDRMLPLKIAPMPNRKTDTNNRGAFSTDNIGRNYDYPEATYARRREIIREHETYQKGLLWSLANHPRVLEAIRREVSRWGLAADEFTDNGHWPHQLYIREARRMVSDYVMTEHDCRGRRAAPDPVALGSYNMDSHNCQRYVTAEGHVQNEGDIQVGSRPYGISFRSLVPRAGEVENLVVPVCVSASHIAYGSIRMEPVFMMLGQVAGTAAAQAVEAGTAVQKLDYETLRERLESDGLMVEPPGGAAALPVLLKRDLEGVVVDDDAAETRGEWPPSSAVAPYVGMGYRHDDNRGKGEKSVRYEAALEPGRYEVRLAYSPHGNRAGNVPVTVHHAEGETTVRVDQRKEPSVARAFVLLGTFRFGEAGVVVVSNAGTTGHVIADAVQFLPVK